MMQTTIMLSEIADNFLTICIMHVQVADCVISQNMTCLSENRDHHGHKRQQLIYLPPNNGSL